MVRPLAYKLWAKPEPGAQPILILELNGEAEPRLTSGGEAGVDGIKFSIGS